jgi:hypothetical protein
VLCDEIRLDPTKKGDLKEAFNVNNSKQMDPWWARHRAELAAAQASALPTSRHHALMSATHTD